MQIIRVCLITLFYVVVLGQPAADKDQNNPLDLTIKHDNTPLVTPQSRSMEPRPDIKLAHQSGEKQSNKFDPQPYLPGQHSTNFDDKDSSDQFESLGDDEKILLESATVPVAANTALSRNRRLFLPYLSSYLNRRPYSRRPYYAGGIYPYYFGGVIGYPYYGGYGYG